MKKVLKSSLSLFLAIAIIFGSAAVGLTELDLSGLFAVKASAASSGTTGDCICSLNGTVLTISGNGEMGDYTYYSPAPWSATPITKVIIEEGVTSIGDEAFLGCRSLTSITIPNSVKSIGGDAFSGCRSLTSITIPDSVKSIGGYAFFYCESLTSINIPDNVSIAAYAFGNCRSLSSVALPNSILRIPGYVFYGCTSLTSINIPDGVTSIGDYAFYGCTSLMSITIPDSVTSIGDQAFSSCKSLASINISDSVTDIGRYAFSSCTSLTSINIPDSVTNIQSGVFWNCTSLVSINISDNVKTIGYGAFYLCSSLKDVYYKGSETDFGLVTVDVSNEYLLKSNWHYNSKGPKPATPKVATTNEIGGVNITWNAVDGAVKYNVYRRQGGSNTWTLVGTTTGTSLTDTKVSCGVYYVYSVRAYNNADQYSDFVSANTQTRKYMAVPKLKGISNATNGLYITWNPVAGVTNGYRVYRRGAGSTYWTYLGTTKNTYFTDTQVKNNSGEYFRYTVIADGGYHSKFDTTGLYLRRLSNPTLKSAVSSKTGITVKWTPVKGCLGYYVYRKTANSGWVRVGVVNGVNSSSFVDKTAQKGVTYTYTVRAVCGNVTSYFNSGISCKDKY